MTSGLEVGVWEILMLVSAAMLKGGGAGAEARGSLGNILPLGYQVVQVDDKCFHYPPRSSQSTSHELILYPLS